VNVVQKQALERGPKGRWRVKDSDNIDPGQSYYDIFWLLLFLILDLAIWQLHIWTPEEISCKNHIIFFGHSLLQALQVGKVVEIVTFGGPTLGPFFGYNFCNTAATHTEYTFLESWENFLLEKHNFFWYRTFRSPSYGTPMWARGQNVGLGGILTLPWVRFWSPTFLILKLSRHKWHFWKAEKISSKKNITFSDIEPLQALHTGSLCGPEVKMLDLEIFYPTLGPFLVSNFSNTQAIQTQVTFLESWENFL
jgi:hypothetical protein